MNGPVVVVDVSEESEPLTLVELPRSCAIPGEYAAITSMPITTTAAAAVRTYPRPCFPLEVKLIHYLLSIIYLMEDLPPHALVVLHTGTAHLPLGLLLVSLK